MRETAKKKTYFLILLVVDEFFSLLFPRRNFLRFSIFLSSFLIRGVLLVSKVLMLISNFRIYISLACKPNHFYRPFGRVAQFHSNFFSSRCDRFKLDPMGLLDEMTSLSLSLLLLRGQMPLRRKKTQQQTNSRDLFSVVMV